MNNKIKIMEHLIGKYIFALINDDQVFDAPNNYVNKSYFKTKSSQSFNRNEIPFLCHRTITRLQIDGSIVFDIETVTGVVIFKRPGLKFKNIIMGF